MVQNLTNINETKLSKFGLNAKQDGDAITIYTNEKNFRGLYDAIYIIHGDNDNELASKLNDFVADENKLSFYTEIFKETREKYHDIEANFDRSEIIYSIDNDDKLCQQSINCALKLNDDRSVDLSVDLINNFIKQDSDYMSLVNRDFSETIAMDGIEFTRDRHFESTLNYDVRLDESYQATFPNIQLDEIDNIVKNVVAVTNEDSFVREFAEEIHENDLSEELADKIKVEYLHEDELSDILEGLSEVDKLYENEQNPSLMS